MTTYLDAGVDIEEGEEAVRKIKPIVRQTFTPGVLTDIGAFGAFFKLDSRGYEDPVLVSSVDGVGTKLKVAFHMDRHDTVGQCLVNHCVNDIAVCGAKPLFFLDYFATGKLSSDRAAKVIEGIAKACEENGCALIGGETAEMPDIYARGEYDLAGTVVGVVEREKIIDGKSIAAGDVLIGLPSTGLHTNGFSLGRKILSRFYTGYDTPRQLKGELLGENLLRIHRSYLQAIQVVHNTGKLKGAIHVTGGGIPGNAVRVVPKGLHADINYDAWERPAIFHMIEKLGSVSEEEMRRTFNLGIGMIFVVDAAEEVRVMGQLVELGEEPVTIGRIARSISD